MNTQSQKVHGASTKRVGIALLVIGGLLLIINVLGDGISTGAVLVLLAGLALLVVSFAQRMLAAVEKR